MKWAINPVTDDKFTIVNNNELGIIDQVQCVAPWSQRNTLVGLILYRFANDLVMLNACFARNYCIKPSHKIMPSLIVLPISHIVKNNIVININKPIDLIHSLRILANYFPIAQNAIQSLCEFMAIPIIQYHECDIDKVIIDYKNSTDHYWKTIKIFHPISISDDPTLLRRISCQNFKKNSTLECLNMCQYLDNSVIMLFIGFHGDVFGQLMDFSPELISMTPLFKIVKIAIANKNVLDEIICMLNNYFVIPKAIIDDLYEFYGS